MWYIYILTFAFWKSKSALPLFSRKPHALSLSYSSSSQIQENLHSHSLELEENSRRYQVIPPLHSKLINFSFIYIICDLHMLMCD